MGCTLKSETLFKFLNSVVVSNINFYYIFEIQNVLFITQVGTEDLLLKIDQSR